MGGQAPRFVDNQQFVVLVGDVQMNVRWGQIMGRGVLRLVEPNFHSCFKLK